MQSCAVKDRRRAGDDMPDWKRAAADFFNTVRAPVYGAGFRKPGVDLAGHPCLVTFDGHSVYFSGLGEREAARLLDGVTLLNGRTGWLAYILHEVFYDERAGEDLYGALYDGLESGALKGPRNLSGESVYLWVESVAPEVERMRSDLIGRRERGPGAGPDGGGGVYE